MNKNLKKITYFLIIVFCFTAFSTASAVGQPPVVDAGQDLYLISGQNLPINASASDPEGGTLSYYWNCNGGLLSSYTGLQPIYTAPVVIAYDNRAIYTCTLTVTDSSGLSNSDTVKMYINYDNTVNPVYINVKTETATNVSSNQARLNGSFTSSNDSPAYAWFEYGFSSNYGNETSHQQVTGTSGTFGENLSSLFLSATYHYRAVIQNSSGNRFYGQDMTFSTQTNTNTQGGLSISKKAINLTSGNLSWSKTINAKPSDIIGFSIVLQPTQNLTNVVIKDVLPAGLTYNDNLLINATQNSSQNPTSGINIGSITAGEISVISFQAKVNSFSLPLGTSNLTVNTTVDSDQTNEITDNVVITVNNSQVSGVVDTPSPTDLPTGQTNNIFIDSFFLPMLLIIAGSWFYFSGRVYSFADWLNRYL